MHAGESVFEMVEIGQQYRGGRLCDRDEEVLPVTKQYMLRAQVFDERLGVPVDLIECGGHEDGYVDRVLLDERLGRKACRSR
jgi:hypothetical protein